MPGERQRHRAGDGADQREIEHDRGRGLALRQPPRLDHGAGVAEGRDDGEHRAGGGDRGAGAGVMADVEMRDQHHHHAGKADEHRRPAIDAHALLQHDRRERHRDQRRGKRDRGGVGQRQPRERGEIGEHAADAEQPAAELAERPAGVDRARQLAAHGIDHHHRHDGEGRAEEHHLANRRDVAELAHQRRHDGKQQRRDQLEADGLEQIHRQLIAAIAGACPASGLRDARIAIGYSFLRRLALRPAAAT